MKREAGKRFVLSMVLAAAWCAPALGQQYSDQLAASVNGEVITLSEVEQVIRQRLADGHTSPERFEALRHEVLGMLIDDCLLRQYLSKNGPQVPETEVQRWLKQLEAKLKNDGKTLHDYYRELGSSESDLKKSVTQMLQWVRFVNDQLTDEALERYYHEHRDFFDQVTVRASHIVIRVPAASKELRDEARARLNEMRQEIVAGQLDFAAAARKYSQCPSAEKGGDIGFFPRHFAVDEEIARAAFSQEVGKISDVVATEHGLHLILVTDRKAGKKTEFSQVKAAVREVAAGEMMQKLLDQEKQTAKINVFLSETAPVRNAAYDQRAETPPQAQPEITPVYGVIENVPAATPPAGSVPTAMPAPPEGNLTTLAPPGGNAALPPAAMPEVPAAPVPLPEGQVPSSSPLPTPEGQMPSSSPLPAPEGQGLPAAPLPVPQGSSITPMPERQSSAAPAPLPQDFQTPIVSGVPMNEPAPTPAGQAMPAAYTPMTAGPAAPFVPQAAVIEGTVPAATEPAPLPRIRVLPMPSEPETPPASFEIPAVPAAVPEPAPASEQPVSPPS
ncbi:MAG: peptidylprolyl isomerase [Gemmataceae bacterium]